MISSLRAIRDYIRRRLKRERVQEAPLAGFGFAFGATEDKAVVLSDTNIHDWRIHR